jgi:hypothetical protein
MAEPGRRRLAGGTADAGRIEDLSHIGGGKEAIFSVLNR